MVRRLAGLFRELESEACRWIKTEGNTLDRIGFTASFDPRYQGAGIRPAGLHLRLAAPQAQRGGDWRVVPSRAREGLRFPRTRNTDRDHVRAPPGHGQYPPDPPACGPIRRSSAPARESPGLPPRAISRGAGLRPQRSRIRRSHKGAGHRRAGGIDGLGPAR